jgi:hypothetical protein
MKWLKANFNGRGNNVTEVENWNEAGSGMGATVAAPVAQTFDLHGYCYSERGDMLPRLSAILAECGGWVLDRRTTASTSLEYRFEIQLAGILDLYSAMVGMGLELTRGAHGVLTDLCTCRQHITRSIDPCQILTLRLEISFLTDVTLHSLLMTGSSLA